MKRKNMKISGIMLAGVIIIVSFVYAINIPPAVTGGLDDDSLAVNPGWSWVDIADDGSHSYNMFSFSSYDELTGFLNNCSSVNYRGYNGYWHEGGMDFEIDAVPMITFAKSDGVSVGGSDDFSQTNIQVAGVDEPDSVKTDGKYLYLTKGNIVYIVLAYPAKDAKVVSKINIGQNVNNIFINGDKLVAFGSQNHMFEIDGQQNPEPVCWYSSPSTFIKVYDIQNREEPELKRDIVIAGDYYNARMIGDNVYIITNQNQWAVRPNFDDNSTIVPLISENGLVKRVPLEDIYCIDIPQNSYTLTHVVSIDIKDENEEVVDKIFTMGNSGTMYVSKSNIYITYDRSRSNSEVRQEVYDEILMPLLSEKIQNDIECTRNFDISENNKKQVINWILEDFLNTLNQSIKDDIGDEIQRRLCSTVVHKISVIDGKIEYMANGSVPGNILNQFSMDEHKGFFRVATQLNGWWAGNSKKSSNVYILDSELKIVGRINNIAPGENLHSARFMGDRAYLVTFLNIDPFFALDLSDPYNPQILGELKIPGYSDYLHPFDENHIIGIGKDSDASMDADRIHSDNAVYYTAILGVKIALFDVSDFDNPKETSKVVIGDRGTDTPVLTNHKAFLFDKEKELLVIPISLYEVSQQDKEQNQEDWRGMRGSFKLCGAYVYKLTAEEGFELKGVITHSDNQEISRSLYIDSALYTISRDMVKINDLDDLSEINTVNLN